MHYFLSHPFLKKLVIYCQTNHHFCQIKIYILLGNFKPILILFKKVYYNLFSQFEQMHNGNAVVHTTYGQFLYMLYGYKVFFIQHMDKLSICCMGKPFYP